MCEGLGKFAEAIAGLNLFAALAISAIGHAHPGERRQARALAGLVDWVGLGVVVGPGYTISTIHGFAWLLGPFAATILYPVSASLQWPCCQTSKHQIGVTIQPRSRTRMCATAPHDR